MTTAPRKCQPTHRAATVHAHRVTVTVRQHTEITAHLTAIDARLRRVPDARRTDVLATLPTATAAMLAVILPMLGVAAVVALISLQVGLWIPVAYKVIRKL